MDGLRADFFIARSCAAPGGVRASRGAGDLGNEEIDVVGRAIAAPDKQKGVAPGNAAHRAI